MKKGYINQDNFSPSYHAANHFKIQLIEYAKFHKLDFKKIKIFDRKQCKENKIKADYAIIWEDGPEEWALNFDILPCFNVDIIPYGEYGNIVAFYDIFKNKHS